MAHTATAFATYVGSLGAHMGWEEKPGSEPPTRCVVEFYFIARKARSGFDHQFDQVARLEKVNLAQLFEEHEEVGQTPFTLHPTPYTLHPTPCTDTLDPALNTLHSAPGTLHPALTS